MEEVWKDIPGYEGRYQVSDKGRVRSLDKILSLCNVSGGYKAVSLGTNNSKTIHRLVALAFLGVPPPEKRLVLHADGNRANNALTNLRYGNYYDNAADAKQHGTQVKGEKQHAAKLTSEQVAYIRASDLSAYALARKFCVTPQCIYLVLKRKNWRHV